MLALAERYARNLRARIAQVAILRARCKILSIRFLDMRDL